MRASTTRACLIGIRSQVGSGENDIRPLFRRFSRSPWALTWFALDPDILVAFSAGSLVAFITAAAQLATH